MSMEWDISILAQERVILGIHNFRLTSFMIMYICIYKFFNVTVVKNNQSATSISMIHRRENVQKFNVHATVFLIFKSFIGVSNFDHKCPEKNS